MKFERLSGVLLHPTSLPGPFGIGDLGPQAHRWIDFLGNVGCGLWQVLPLGPTGYGDSPYQCFSAFAGNPYIISPEFLMEDGLLIDGDLNDGPDFPRDRVDYGQLIPWKVTLLNRAFERFKSSGLLETEYHAFRQAQHLWLEDFALFMAIKEAHEGAPWVDWPAPLRKRQVDVLNQFRRENEVAVQQQVFWQFIFFRQWERLRAHASERQVRIIGDIPIYVSHDSADVWVNPDFYALDEHGQPTVVAGVPPDYFSSTGQLWGNPLYRWEVHRADGYRWWLARLGMVLQTVDLIRLDHFRGFAGYWEVPAGHPTAEHGRWVSGPGEAFFDLVKDKFGELPLIAEDLGEITPDVVSLRDRHDLPGMKIFQFGLEGDLDDDFLPHNYPENCVAYTGTHDNDTARGWYQNATPAQREFAHQYLASDGENFAKCMIGALWNSPARMVLAPMQDLLGLGNEARMNYPGRPHGNWAWRMTEDALSEELLRWVADLNRGAGRSTVA